MNTSELVHSAVSIAEVLKRFGPNTLLLNEAGGVLRYADEAAYAQRAPFKATKRTLVLCLTHTDFGGLIGYLALLAGDAIPLMAGAENRIYMSRLLLRSVA